MASRNSGAALAAASLAVIALSTAFSPVAAAVTAQPVATSVTVTSSPSPATPYDPLTLIATVRTASGSAAATSGTVTFMSGTHTLGTATVDELGLATLSTVAPAPGTYYASAVYSGGGAFAASQSPVILETVRESYEGLFELTATDVHGSAGYRALSARHRIAADGQLSEIDRLLALAARRASDGVLAATIYDAYATVAESEDLLSVAQAEALLGLAAGLPAPAIVTVVSLGHTLKGHTVHVGTLKAGDAELTLRRLGGAHGASRYRLLIRTRSHGRVQTLLSHDLKL